MNEFLGFTWAYAAYWYTVIGVVSVIMLIAWLAYLDLRRADRLGFKKRADQLFKNFSRVKKFSKGVLISISVVLLWTSLMRPQKDDDEHTVQMAGRDLVIALDISRSMLAKDMDGDTIDRLTFAKKKIQALVSTLATDRVSLMLFAGTAFVYCPLTADYVAFLSLLNAVDTHMTAAGSTSLEKALEKALELFERSPESKSKVLVMFTDGEDFSHNLNTVKVRAQQQGVSIFTVGIGTTNGAPIALYTHDGRQQGFQKDKQGSAVITCLNEKVLEGVARECGGCYIKATNGSTDIATLCRQLEKFEKDALYERTVRRKKEFFNYFSTVAGLLLLIEWLL